jgi:hypothetical protein
VALSVLAAELVAQVTVLALVAHLVMVTVAVVTVVLVRAAAVAAAEQVVAAAAHQRVIKVEQAVQGLLGIGLRVAVEAAAVRELMMVVELLMLLVVLAVAVREVGHEMVARVVAQAATAVAVVAEHVLDLVDTHQHLVVAETYCCVT